MPACDPRRRRGTVPTASPVIVPTPAPPSTPRAAAADAVVPKVRSQVPTVAAASKPAPGPTERPACSPRRDRPSRRSRSAPPFRRRRPCRWACRTGRRAGNPAATHRPGRLRDRRTGTTGGPAGVESGDRRWPRLVPPSPGHRVCGKPCSPGSSPEAPRWDSTRPPSTRTARPASTRSASSAASSATSRSTSGSSSSPTPGSTAGKRPAGNSTSGSATPTPGPPPTPRQRVDLARQHGLEIFTVATHLQGQVLGDEPSREDAQLLQPQGRRPRRPTGNGARPATARPRPTRTTSPPEVGDARPRRGPARPASPAFAYAAHLSKLQDRKVALPGFVGSPANCWSHWFLFPPLPPSIDGLRPPGRPRPVAGTARRTVRPGLGAVQATTA